MKRVFTISLVIALFFGLLSSVHAQDTGAEEISLTDVPRWILDTAQRAGDHMFGSVTLETVQFDPEGDLPTYEFSGSAEGVEGFEIDVYPDGTLSEVEETIAEGDVPSELMNTLTTYFADLQVEQYERSTRPGKNGVNEIWYEFAGTYLGGEVDIEISEDGSTIVIELPSQSM